MKRILLITLLSLFSASTLVFASETAESKDSVSVSTDSRGVSARRYRMQKRYRPADKSLYPVNGGFLSDTYTSVSASSFIPFIRDYSHGEFLNLSFGKRFTPLHGIRISGNFGHYYDNFSSTKYNDIRLVFYYLFNCSAYLGGYDESRFCDIFPIVGAGVDIIGKAPFFALEGRLGLNFNMHLFKNLDLYFEPDLQIRRDPSATIHSDNWRGMMFGLNTSIGLSYRFQNPCPQDYTPGKNWFVYMSGGTLIQNSEMNRQLNTKDRFGWMASVGGGRHCTDAFDLRAGLTVSYYNWRYSGGTNTLKNSNYSVLAEGILDIVALATGKSDRWIGAGVVGGMDFGYMDKKYHLSGANISHFYAGFHGGLDVTFRIKERFQIFIEPEYTYRPYCASSSDSKSNSINANYNDDIFSVAIGIIYNFKK